MEEIRTAKSKWIVNIQAENPHLLWMDSSVRFIYIDQAFTLMNTGKFSTILLGP